MERLNRDEAKAICKIPPSQRYVLDSIIWLHKKNGVYSVKLGYHLARKVVRKDNWVESSKREEGQLIWKSLWKMRGPSKLKVFFFGELAMKFFLLG